MNDKLLSEFIAFFCVISMLTYRESDVLYHMIT